MGLTPIECFRLAICITAIGLLVCSRSLGFTRMVMLEVFIRACLVLGLMAFIVTISVTLGGFYIVVFGLLFAGIFLLIRTIRFDIFANSHSSWANRSAIELLLISQSLIYWVLFLWGWKSMLFIAISFTATIFLLFSFRRNSSIHKLLVPTVGSIMVVVGSAASRSFVQPYSSDYFLSYDQIYRGSIATGLTRWGLQNSNYGFGRSLRYHWLGESITGLIARLSGATEIDSIARISPYFGISLFVIACVALLIALGTSLWVTFSVVIFTAGFINQVDPASVGTLWGGAFFMTAILFVLVRIHEISSWQTSSLLVVTAGMTILSQSLLGFVLILSIIGLCATKIVLRRGNFATEARLMIVLFLVPIVLYFVFFRSTSLFGHQSLGPNNWLRLPGVPIQLGGSSDSRNFAIHLNSLFFVFYFASVFGFSFFGLFRKDLLGTLTKLFALQFALSFVLINLIDLGEFNVKFLAPIGLLGTFLGVLTVSNFFENILKSRFGFVLMFGVFLLVFGLQQEELYNWLINYREGLVYLICIGLAFLVVFFGVLRSRNLSSNRFVFSFGLVVPLLCSLFFVLSKVESLQNSRVFQASYSMEPMLDSGQTRNCLDFVRNETPESSVIATSLWRIPGGTDEKYFLTSLLTHRLVLLDGPVYSRGLDWPSLEYFENLKNIHTSFSNSFDSTSHDQLVDLGATYFLLDTRTENLDRTWVNFDGQNVVFVNQDCAVIKL
jgi:hypothetical protein